MGRQRQSQKNIVKSSMFLGYRNDVAGVTGSARRVNRLLLSDSRSFCRKQLHAGDEIQAAGEARKSNSGGDPGRGPAGASRQKTWKKQKSWGRTINF